MMKNIKILFKTVIALLIFNACTENERDLAFLAAIQAPSNLAISYDITQDNTGLVTIMPTAEGAAQIEVFFGDGTEESETIANGNSVQRTYGEGNYNVKVVASNTTGEATELTEPLVVSFKAPENLVVVVENDVSTSKQVNVTASADFATMFDFYTGVEGAEPISGNIGETISYTYQNPGTYEVKVVAKGAAIQTTEYTASFEVTEILAPTEVAPTPPSRIATDVVSIFSDAYTDVTLNELPTEWSSTGFEATTVGTDNVWKLTALDFLGIVTNYDSGIDVSAMEKLHIDYWVPEGTTNGLAVKIVNTVDSGEAEVSLGTTVGGTWQSIELDMTDFDGGNLANKQKITQILLDAKDGNAGVVYIDNFYFYKEATVFNTLPVNFESTVLNYNWVGFGDPNFGPIPATVVTNPDKSGINATNNVLQIDKPAGSQVWAGASMALDQAIDFTNGTTITVKVWSPRVGTTMLLKMEDPTSPADGNGNPTVFAEATATSTVANQWEELSFDMTTFADFSASIAYKNVIFFPDFGNGGQGESFFFDDIAIASIQLPVNFEVPGLTYTWTGFGDPNFGPIPTAIIPNPDATGVNTSATVLEVQKPGGSQVWAGASMPLNNSLNFAYGTTVKIKVWSPRVGTNILLKIEDPTSPPDGNGNPTVFVEVMGTSTVAGQWEELSFDLTTFSAFSTSINYGTLIVFPDFGNGGQGESFYFDDFILTN